MSAQRISSDPLINKTIGGYQIQSLIGRGGFGKVYKGVQKKLDRSVAVKILSQDYFDDKERADLMLREAKTGAACSHQNIIHVYDVGEEGGLLYIVMEYIEGENLSKITKKIGKWDPWKALSIIGQAAAALEAAHKNKVIHRDIKPENIIITKEGAVKVADFGLAKSLEGGSTLTQTGQIRGTPYYMSPEQCSGISSDEKTDIYSLGASFYYMVTGRQPFVGEKPLSIMLQHMNKDLTPPAEIVKDIPPEINDLIIKMMAKKRQERHKTTIDLVKEINNILREHSLESEIRKRSAKQKVIKDDSAVDAPTVKLKPRHIKPVIILPVILVSVLAIGAILLFASSSSEPGEETKTVQLDKISRLLKEVKSLLLAGEYGKAKSKYELVLKHDKSEYTPELKQQFNEVTELFNRKKDKKAQLTKEAELALRKGDIDEALEKYNSSSEIDKANSSLKEKISNLNKLKKLFTSAKKLTNDGDFITAIKIYNQILELNPGNEQAVQGLQAAKEKLFDFYIKNGVTLYSEHQWQMALEEFEEALSLKPNDSETLKFIEKCKKLVEYDKTILINKGAFSMGSEEGLFDESPSTRIEIPSFYMDKYEVTMLEYSLFIADGGYENKSLWTDRGWMWRTNNKILKPLNWNLNENNEGKPVVGVSWHEAYAYARWRNKRLPTEAEWEYAARGKGNLLWPWGNKYVNRFANFNSVQSSAVGSYPEGASWSGIHDLLGNVWEWCADWYSSDYYSRRKGKITGPDKGVCRVIRGGSFLEPHQDITAYSRMKKTPETRSEFIGFRCVKDKK